jgi:diguanylate cyclase (GGDEF)-like protein
MREKLRKKLCLTTLALCAAGLVCHLVGGFFEAFILPLLLTLAMLATLPLCRSRTAPGRAEPSAAPAAEPEPHLVQQTTQQIQAESAQLQVSALGANYRRSELAATETIVDAILEDCLRLLSGRIDAHTIAILFPTRDNGYQIRRFVSKSEYINRDAVIYPGVGVIGGFLKDGLKQLTLDEIVTDSITLYYYTRDAGIRSLIASPIIVDGVERGTIIADSTEKKHFSEEMHAFLSAVADICGKAVYYTYLLNEHRLQYHHLVAMSGLEKFFFQMHDINAILDKMAEIIPFAFRCDRMTISLKEREGDGAVVRRAWGLEAEALNNLRFTVSEKTLAGIIYTKNIILLRNFSAEHYETRFADGEPVNRELGSFLAVPLGVNAGTGLIMLESRHPDAFSESNKELLVRLATSAGLAIEKIEVLRQTQNLATHDGLTGLSNHRQFQQHLKEAITRSIRYKDPLSLVICDIDHFKKVNDTYGHRFGDVVLKAVAATLQSSIRQDIDVAARYGGEEFALVLEKTDSKTAQETAERIRKLMEKAVYQTPKGNEITVTMSFGIAIYGVHAKNQEALIQKSDKALYRAKENGRNRVELYYDVEAATPAKG